MITRAVVVALTLVGLLASPALAAEAPRGRGPTAQAMMDAGTVWSGSGPVQVLNELCENPSSVRRCSPISPALQSALEQAIDQPITWVDARHRNGPQFWVFAPVGYEGDQATSEYAWWDPGTLGCFGGGGVTWERRQGSWNAFSAFGWVGCPAT
jgi:hypothetical protein